MNDMRNLFFIVKGQYKKGAEPSVVNSINDNVHYLGGFDPYNDDTAEWYMALDNVTFTTISCGGDLGKVLECVYKCIKRFKGDRNKYVKTIRSSDTKESPIMQEMMKHIYHEFGEYFREDIERMEDLAYSEIKEEKPVFKNRKLVSKVKSIGLTTPQEEEVLETPTLKTNKPKVRLGVKKLK